MKLTKLQPTDKRNRKLFNSCKSYFHYLFNICWKTFRLAKRFSSSSQVKLFWSQQIFKYSGASVLHEGLFNNILNLPTATVLKLESTISIVVIIVTYLPLVSLYFPASIRKLLFFCCFQRVQIEAVVQRCYMKKVFLKISQNPQENTCARISFLIELQALGLRFQFENYDVITFILRYLYFKKFWSSHFC